MEPEEEPEPISDFGFTFPDEIVIWHREWSRHGNLPDAGGVRDQDERAMADIYRMEAIVQDKIRELMVEHAS